MTQSKSAAFVITDKRRRYHVVYTGEQWLEAMQSRMLMMN